MSTTDNVSLEFLGHEIRRMQEQLAVISRDHNRLLESHVQLMRVIQNLDRRLYDVKEELEGTIKIELGGAMANLETRLDGRFTLFIEDMRTMVREELRTR
jgi:hypothetical protein